MNSCRFSEFLIQLCKEKRFLGGFVQKYYFFWGSCRNITVPSYCIAAILCRASFRVCAEILSTRLRGGGGVFFLTDPLPLPPQISLYK